MSAARPTVTVDRFTYRALWVCAIVSLAANAVWLIGAVAHRSQPERISVREARSICERALMRHYDATAHEVHMTHPQYVTGRNAQGGIGPGHVVWLALVSGPGGGGSEKSCDVQRNNGAVVGFMGEE